MSARRATFSAVMGVLCLVVNGSLLAQTTGNLRGTVARRRRRCGSPWERLARQNNCGRGVEYVKAASRWVFA